MLMIRREVTRLETKNRKKIWIIIGSLAGGIILCYLAVSVYFFGHFYINTEINGQSFSGKTVSDVEEYIKNQVQDYELTVIEQNNETDVIKGTDISLTYQENNDIEDALSAQNPLLWPMAFFEKSTSEWHW